ncbi:MAG TPA: hypothetical protein VFB74_25445 [Kribbellaceae bacterium]|nr:hypothetical protein [Kribbellaceae bacterium]
MLTIAPLIASVVALLTAVLAFGASRKAHALSVRTAAQQDRRGRSEETMRLLRWAVELAVDPDVRRSLAGTATLRALSEARLVVSDDRRFVRQVATEVAFMTAGSDYAGREEFHTDADLEGDGRG